MQGLGLPLASSVSISVYCDFPVRLSDRLPLSYFFSSVNLG